MVLIFTESFNDNNASCYLDPERKNCSRSLNELINIESEKFVPYLATSSFRYEYRPQTHSYTLIALEKSMNRGAIFDPRLENLEGYGYDFVNITYKVCNGKVIINNPPPIEGIWNDI